MSKHLEVEKTLWRIPEIERSEMELTEIELANNVINTQVHDVAAHRHNDKKTLY